MKFRWKKKIFFWFKKIEISLKIKKKKNFFLQKSWNFVEKKKIFFLVKKSWNFVEKKKFFFGQKSWNFVENKKKNFV